MKKINFEKEEIAALIIAAELRINNINSIVSQCVFDDNTDFRRTISVLEAALRKLEKMPKT